MSLKSDDHSDVMAELMEAGAVLVGSPTHNNTILPLVSGLLTYMKGLRPQNKIAAGFGSFGWSGECLKQISERLGDMGFTMIDGVKVKNAPKHEHLGRLRGAWPHRGPRPQREAGPGLDAGPTRAFAAPRAVTGRAGAMYCPTDFLDPPPHFLPQSG